MREPKPYPATRSQEDVRGRARRESGENVRDTSGARHVIVWMRCVLCVCACVDGSQLPALRASSRARCECVANNEIVEDVTSWWRARAFELNLCGPFGTGKLSSSLKTFTSAQSTGCVLTREKSNLGCAGSGVPSGSDKTTVSGAVTFRAVSHRYRAVVLKDYRHAKKQYDRRSRGSLASTATLPESQLRVTKQLYMAKADFMKQRHV